MDRIKKNSEKVGCIILAIIMTLGVIFVPGAVWENDHSHVSAEPTTYATEEHKCQIPGWSGTIDQATMNWFVSTGRVDAGGYNFEYGPLIVKATEDIHWNGTITVPDGVFIGICTGGFDYSMGELVYEGDGGVYLLDCSVDMTLHSDCQAYHDDYPVYLTQEWSDMYCRWAEHYYSQVEGFSLISSDTYVALSEDVTVLGDAWAPANGVSLNVCLNGHTLTISEGVDLEKNGGTVNIVDCTRMPKLIHDCAVAHFNTDPITQDNLSDYLAQLSYIPSGRVVYLHLAEDITTNVTVSVPEGVVVAVCLNGYTLDCEIDNSSNVTGGFFTYKCRSHTCHVDDVELEAQYTLTQDVVDFLEAVYEIKGDGYFSIDALALAEDVTLRSEMWLSDYGHELVICKNGYSINDEAGLNLSFGDVLYINCSKMGLDDIVYESALLGYSYPMTNETFNDFYEAIEPFEIDGYTRYRFGGEEGIFLFHLAEDVTLESPLEIPLGVFVVILTNGHSFDGEYSHCDLGGTFVFDDTLHLCITTGDMSIGFTEDLVDLMVIMNGGSVDLDPETYVALNADIDYLDSRFVVGIGCTLYVCKNGHSISDEVVAQLCSGGGRVILMDCADQDHNECSKIGCHEPIPGNSILFKEEYMTSEGVLDLAPGTYYMYLAGNTKLERQLIIPSGVDLHLCLNGFMLMSPLITDAEYATSTRPECHGTITVMPQASLTVYDCSATESGLIAVDLSDNLGWGGLAAHAVENRGTFVLNSGTLFGMMTLINSGDATIEDGAVLGVLIGVVSGLVMDNNSMGETTGDCSITVSGGVVSATVGGVVGTEGVVTIDGGDVRAGYIGVGSGILDSKPAADGGADIELYSGSVYVGVMDVEAFAKVGFVIDPEDGMGVSTDEMFGVVCGARTVICEDFVIYVNEKAAEKVLRSGDIKLAAGVEPQIIPSKNGTGNGNSFSVDSEDGKLPAEIENSGTFTPTEGSAFETDPESGEIIIVDVKTTALITGFSLSTSGLISVNIYTDLSGSFIKNPNSAVIIEIDGKTYEFKVSDAVKRTVNGETRYMFSFGIDAKDYLEKICIDFTDGKVVWRSQNSINNSNWITMNQYFDAIKNDTAGIYNDYTKNLAKHMQNYCMTAAAHFMPDEHTYSPDADMAEWMDAFYIDDLGAFANVLEGSSECVKIAGSSIILKSGTSIRIYFSVLDGYDLNEIEVTVNGNATKAKYSSSNRLYYVEIANIYAKDLATEQSISIDGLVAKLSVLTYGYIVYKGIDSQPADVINVCKALYGYYEAAYAYANRGSS